MKTSIFKSLRARLIIGAVVWIAIGIYAAGIFIAELFRQFATDLVDSELRTSLEELMTLIDVDSSGFPHLARPLSDPRFGQDGSGFSWQVSRAGKSLIKSLSASADELPVPNDAIGTNDVRQLTLDGPHGPMITYERSFLPEESVLPPLRIQTDAEFAVIDRMAQSVVHDQAERASLPPNFAPSPLSEIVWLSDLWTEIGEIRRTTAQLSANGARGHIVQVVDPAEETFPYWGRVEFVEPEGGGRITAGRAETWRTDYTARVQRHRSEIRAETDRLGWSFTIHRTDRSASELLLALQARIGAGANDIGYRSNAGQQRTVTA